MFEADEGLERRGRRVGGRMEMEHDIHAAERLQSELPHPHLHQVRGVEEPREIVEDVLGVAFGAEPDDRQPRRLRSRAHDRQVLSYQGVEQRGFPHVRRTGEGDVAASGHGGKLGPWVETEKPGRDKKEARTCTHVRASKKRLATAYSPTISRWQYHRR